MPIEILMRTIVAFGLVVAALFAIGVTAAAVMSGPPKDLFLPPPGDETCDTRSPTSTESPPDGEADPRASAREV